MAILEAKNIYKNYEGNDVLASCNLTISEGEIVGLLGKNGAGKSTLFKILTGLAGPDQGQLLFQEKDCLGDNEWLVDVGFFVNEPVFYWHQTARENLEIHLAYMNKSIDNIDFYLSKVGLDPNNPKPVKSYSTGMKQRLGIARALCHEPKLLILDEPINGLDPTGIKEMRQLFIELAKVQGKALLISSHILTEIEHTADRVAVLVDGNIALDATVNELKETHGTDLETILIKKMEGIEG